MDYVDYYLYCIWMIAIARSGVQEDLFVLIEKRVTIALIYSKALLGRYVQSVGSSSNASYVYAMDGILVTYSYTVPISS